jgi:hypothetical protein
MTSPCKTYEEARAAHHEGKLQYWDDQRLAWVDVGPGLCPFFSRNVEDYRRKPEHWQKIPKFLVWTRNQEISACPSTGEFSRRRTHWFTSARDVATFLWEKDVRHLYVFKRTNISSCDLRKIEQQLEAE